jgi:Family of unknown function (DUF6272)
MTQKYSPYQNLLPALKAREIVSYEGVFTHEAVVRFMQDLSVELGGEKPKKLFVVTIELIQNIKNYSAETFGTVEHNKSGVGVATVYDGGDLFIAVSGNVVPTASVERIQAHCMKVQGRTTQELRGLYNEQMKDAPPEGSKGAGLGFIDIALKTSGQVDFEFRTFDNDYTFFTITAFINKL